MLSLYKGTITLLSHISFHSIQRSPGAEFKKTLQIAKRFDRRVNNAIAHALCAVGLEFKSWAGHRSI